MWIPKNKWKNEKIIDWVDIGLTKTDLWVRIPDQPKGDSQYVEQTNKQSIKQTTSPVLN